MSFLQWKNFCLRGGQEQRNLRLSQWKRDTSLIDGIEVNSYVYQEFGSKNRQGGFGSLNLQNKIVRQYQSSSNPDRCHVGILDKYLQLIPPEAKDEDNFYLTPLPKKPIIDQLKSWYTKTPICRNRLNSMLKEMCQEAGISGNFSNHSLRAYGATSSFQAGVPEKLIQQRTGHRTIEALRQYERTSEAQLVDISNTLSNCEKSNSATVSVSKETTSTINHATSSLSNYPGSNMLPVILSGCSFTGCSIAFSGPASNVNNAAVSTDAVVEDVLKGVNINDLFDD